MLKGFAHSRPLSVSMRQGLPAKMAAQLQWAFPVIPLTGFPSLATAFRIAGVFKVPLENVFQYREPDE